MCHNFKRVAQHYKYCCFFCSQCRQRSLLKLSSRGLSHLSETTSIVRKKFRHRRDSNPGAEHATTRPKCHICHTHGPCIHRSSSVQTQQDPVQTVRINLYIENCYLKDAHSFPPNGIRRQGRKRGGGGGRGGCSLSATFQECYFLSYLGIFRSENLKPFPSLSFHPYHPISLSLSPALSLFRSLSIAFPSLLCNPIFVAFLQLVMYKSLPTTFSSKTSHHRGRQRLFPVL